MTLRHRLLLAGMLTALIPGSADAQEPRRLDLGGQFTANGEAERYLRALQLAGRVPMYPVGSRPWTRHEAMLTQPVGDHPWAMRFTGKDSNAIARGVHWLRPSVGGTFNTTEPQGEGEGPVWLGKGMTVHATGGVRATYGRFDIQVAPFAYWAQNAEFPLAPNGLEGDAALRDPRFPGNIDLPQRFGDVSHGRVDPGYSRAAFDSPYLSVGVSTAPLAWGPARDEPLVLGPGAGGFPHVFAGTGQPVPVGIGRLHAKLVTGRLEQSGLSAATAGNRSRMGTAVIVLFVPRGITGLEVGAIRFEHRIWRPGVFTVANVLRPFTSIFNDNVSGINSGDDNGYASVFMRWAAAPHGFEAYAEYGREDYTGSFRWLVQKPDDLGSLLVGVQRVFDVRADQMKVIRAELINAETSSNEVGQRGRLLIPPYTHGRVLQGHTLNGQLLGSPTAYGGAGWKVGFDQYRKHGRTTFMLERRLRRDWEEGPLTSLDPAPQVSYALGADRLATVRDGRSDFTVGVRLTWMLNEHNVRGEDRVMMQASAGWRGF